MAGADPRIGTVLHGRYEILERLTEGAMAVLYRAERVKLQRTVAIKFLHESYAASEDGMHRFQREARAMSRLSHPNCVSVSDFGVDEGAPYLVMDFVTGRTVREVLLEQGRLPTARAVQIVRQVLAGLAHAHGHGIVHRDVKPENILISDVEGVGEQVRLVDFGLAKLRDEGTITTGVALGTPGYMAPEQTVGDKVDERVDLYATGIILYELLVGWKPFKADSPFEVMRMHREVPPPSLAESVPGLQLSSKLEAVVQRALAKAREERFQTATEFLHALEGTPEARGRRPAPWRNWRRHRILIGIAGLIASISVVAFCAQGSSSTPAAGAEPASAAATAADAAAERTAPSGPSFDAGAIPADPEDVARIRAYAASDRAVAIEALERLKNEDPSRPEVFYALGNLHAEQQSWGDAVSAYKAALALDPAYERDDRLIRDLVDALANDEAHEAAGALILKYLGSVALPRLEEAARSTNARLSARAEAVRAQIAAE